MLDFILRRMRSGWPGTARRLAAPLAEMPTFRIAAKSILRPSGSAERVVAAVLLLFQWVSTLSSKS